VQHIFQHYQEYDPDFLSGPSAVEIVISRPVGLGKTVVLSGLRVGVQINGFKKTGME
jgi:hypothetical protein